MKTLVMAAAQTVPIRGDVDANLSQHLSLLQRAAEADVELLVFPELSITGYELDLADELAFASGDSRLDPLRRACREHGMIAIVGAPLRLPSGLHIACFILCPDGDEEIYTKLYVHHSEQQHFQPCDANPLIEIGGLRAAIAICADFKQQKHVARAIDAGANAYVASAFIEPKAYDEDAGILAGYAVEHGMPVLFANFGGRSGRYETAGRSAAWDPEGNLLACAPSSGTALVVVTRGKRWSAAIA